MRIRIVQKPRSDSIDGLHLNQFEVGRQYDVGNTVGALLLAEGWARLVRSEEPQSATPIRPAATPIPPAATPIPPAATPIPPAEAADSPRRRKKE